MKRQYRSLSLLTATMVQALDITLAAEFVEGVLEQVQREIMSKAPNICPKHTKELRMRAQLATLNPKNCVYCFVERGVWASAANVVRNQQGVSHWTDDDTIDLLEQKSKDAADV